MQKKIFTRGLIDLAPYTAKIQNAEIMIIGGSAGSFTLIQQLVAALPEDFAIPVIIILHRGKQYTSTLEDLLQKDSSIKVIEAKEKEIVTPGTIYIAPADYHLLVEQNRSLSLDMSEPVWYCRPSIDVSFQSVAEVYENKMIAILFSGANIDGAEGMTTVFKHDGLALVQDPEDAEFPLMPKTVVDKKTFHLLFRASDIVSLAKKIHAIKNSVYN